MTNLKWIPAQDDFETTLSATWNGWTWSMSVFAVPDGTLPVWEFSYIVVEPWTNNMQVAKVSGWDSVWKTFTVSSIDVEKSHWVNYTAKTHPANSIVRVSNNFAFWKEIQSAIASKVNTTDLWSGDILVMDETTYQWLIPQSQVVYLTYNN